MVFFWQRQRFVLPDEIVVRIFKYADYEASLPLVSSHWCQLYWANISYDQSVLRDRIELFLQGLEDPQQTERFRIWLNKLKTLLIYDKLRVSSTLFANEKTVLDVLLLAIKLNERVLMEWMLQHESGRIDFRQLLLPSIRYRNKFMVKYLRQNKEQFFQDEPLQDELLTAWREAFKSGDLFTFESLHENLKDIHVGDALEAIRTSAQLKHNKVFFFLVEDERTFDSLVQFDANNRGPLENARRGIKVRRILNSAALLLSCADLYFLVSFWLTGKGCFSEVSGASGVRPSLVLSFIRSDYHADGLESVIGSEVEAVANNYLSRFFDFVS